MLYNGGIWVVFLVNSGDDVWFECLKVVGIDYCCILLMVDVLFLFGDDKICLRCFEE